jgi:murein DD-endopeptidase MepM/ murein hydrolase activator NlpD
MPEGDGIMKINLLLSIALLLVMTWLGEPRICNGEFEAQVLVDQIRPGDFLWVTVKSELNTKVHASFLGIEVELVNLDGVKKALIPVSYYTKPGAYKLMVKAESASFTEQKELMIQVIDRKFKEDRIRVPETTRKKILTTQNIDSDTKKTQKARKDAMNSLPPLWKGHFIWPVKGRVSTDFGLIRFVNDVENGRHSGLDIAAPTGTPVVASNKGKVVLAEMLNWSGLTVIVYHGLNLFSSYSHLSATSVNVGDEVNSGDVIGKIGATGLATGPHLHLTFRVGDTPVDPYLFLEQHLDIP